MVEPKPDHQQTAAKGCPMPDDVCADCGYRCGEDITEAELRELFGAPAREIVRTPEDEAYLDWHIAYVEKHGHQP